MHEGKFPHQLKASSVEGFFEFMTKREQLRIVKEADSPWPWSTDPILNEYKFTNVKREDDRTTRWMRANWTGPHGNRPAGEIIFNCALFRYFGTTEFAEALGWQETWSPDLCVALAKERSANGLRVFTGAYIIPTLGHRGPKSEAVAFLILTPLWAARERLASIAMSTQSWEQVAAEMRTLPGFGGTGFMTKEALQDVMQTPVLSGAIDRNSWCPAGPGARRGLNRIYQRPVEQHVREAQLLKEIMELFDKANSVMPGFMPALELHDIQFQLCEYDKYERVRLGQGRPKARYHPGKNSECSREPRPAQQLLL
ncbi:hypothetical protein IM511_07915 [Erythrobacteraceae bacterium E2-1 Yellow Sea]|nr:hypothetical protein [Erythrobacteraceae bacterium E2-1 Yellow Sea]